MAPAGDAPPGAASTPTECRLALHADWSRHPAKRWMTCAHRRGTGWEIAAPEPVGEVGGLLARLRCRAQGGGVAFGIDCPLGLPRDYVRRHLASGSGLRAFLTHLADDPAYLPRLFDVSDTLDEIEAFRPFYPARGLRGMTRASHAARLGLAGPASLSRICDQATLRRPAGAPIFWTLGANQSGKAAISAWRDLVLPALRDAPGLLHLWPFDGDVASWRNARQPGVVLMAETYPAEALSQLGIRLAGSKRRRQGRASASFALRAALDLVRCTLSPGFEAALAADFGEDAAAEDRFDSVVGLVCLLRVLEGARPDGVPLDPWVRTWEGWVLGLAETDIRLRPGYYALN